MSFSGEVDFSELDKALRKYVKVNRRELPQILNAKMFDLQLQAARCTPVAKRSDIARVVENPKYISWWMNQKYGRGGWDLDDRAREVKLLGRRKSSTTYLRSVFIKSANKFKGSQQPNRNGRMPARRVSAKQLRFNTRVVAKRASIRGIGDFEASVRGELAQRDGADGRKKESLLNSCLERAAVIVTKDMVKYIDRKQRENAKKSGFIV